MVVTNEQTLENQFEQDINVDFDTLDKNKDNYELEKISREESFDYKPTDFSDLMRKPLA